LFRIHGDGNEDSDQFVGFPPNWFDIFCRYIAIILQEFQPQLTFIRFLGALLNLGNEFSVGPGARSLSACEIVFASDPDIALSVCCFQIFLPSESILFIEACLIVDQFKRPSIPRWQNLAVIVLLETLAQIASAASVKQSIHLGS